jgi:hypothetical protein
MISIRITDPCAYCNRALRELMQQGCGSREVPQKDADRLCDVLAWIKRQKEKAP